MQKGGMLLQSGMQGRPANHYQDLESTNGWITRAVVLQTYYADEDDRNGWVSNGLQRCVLCDVRTYGVYQRVLRKVPVLQKKQSLWDEDIDIPRPATLNLQGGILRTGSAADSGYPPTAAEDLDGDHVLVGFLDNDPSQPVILPFEMPHPNSNYRPEQANGRVRRLRYKGILMEWDSSSNFTIDATGAAKEALLEQGVEDSASGSGGQITLKTSDGNNQTSIHLNAAGQILFGSDPAVVSTEPMVLGNLWISLMEELIEEIKRITVGTGVGPSTVPLNIVQFEAIKTKVTQKLHVSDFIFGKKSY
jgi:hypothetical protein